MSAKPKIALGLSGGVDSSVSALLLKEQGFDVTAVFMKNWEEDDTDSYCAAADDIADAEKVCEKLGIELLTINFAAEYWDNVFEHFLKEYQAGRTPNPDILCNKEIKFTAFLDYAKHLNIHSIATGHYARIRQVDGEYQLLKGLDPNKDQSYFLYALNQQQLSHSRFPIGELEKSAVRKRAEAAGLITHNKKDSTGICFIGERKFKSFLQQYLPAQPGEMIDAEGNIISHHDGLMYYTIGQRQGLNIGGRKNASEAPWYVAQKNLTTNQLVVVQGHDHPLLLKSELTATQCHWISGITPQKAFECRAKTRYRQQDQACKVTPISDDKIRVEFEQAQRAITPGQSLVLYQGDHCLGGGIIA